MSTATQMASEALELAKATNATVARLVAATMPETVAPTAPPAEVTNSSSRFSGDAAFQDGQILWVPIFMGDPHPSSTGKSTVLGSANGRLGKVRFSASCYQVIK